MNGEKVSFFDSTLWKKESLPNGREVPVDEIPGGKVIAHDGGLLLLASDGKYVGYRLTWLR